MTELISISEAARRLTISKSAVRTLCDQDLLRYCRPSGNPSGHRRIVAASIESYIQSIVSGEPEPVKKPASIARVQPKTGKTDDEDLDDFIASMRKRR